MKQTTQNHVFYGLLTVLGLLAALPPGVINIIPAEYRPVVVAIISIAAWVKSHYNLKAEPPK
jgi:hypothetical protein